MIGKISQLNSRSPSDEDQYRCFIYQRSTENGKTIYNVAQSGDATCTGLDPTNFEGSRTMKLITGNFRSFIRQIDPNLISCCQLFHFLVDDQHKRCKFPEWITSHHTWLSLDHRKTYRFSQRNATLKILDDDIPKPKIQPQYAQPYLFQEFGFQSQDQKKQNTEMRLVCHGILQQQELKKVQIVAHITAGWWVKSFARQHYLLQSREKFRYSDIDFSEYCWNMFINFNFCQLFIIFLAPSLQHLFTSRYPTFFKC